MKIHRVISGGQTGADIAGLRAARACGIRTGGWAPRGYLTERGPKPFLLGRIFGLKEHPSDEYPPRTLANILMADATLIIAGSLDRGSGLTAKLCLRNRRPAFHIHTIDLIDHYPTNDRTGESIVEILQWIFVRKPRIINIAGNRESRSPGIERKAQAFLEILFDMLNEDIPF